MSWTMIPFPFPCGRRISSAPAGMRSTTSIFPADHRALSVARRRLVFEELLLLQLGLLRLKGRSQGAGPGPGSRGMRRRLSGPCSLFSPDRSPAARRGRLCPGYAERRAHVPPGSGGRGQRQNRRGRRRGVHCDPKRVPSGHDGAHGNFGGTACPVPDFPAGKRRNPGRSSDRIPGRGRETASARRHGRGTDPVSGRHTRCCQKGCPSPAWGWSSPTSSTDSEWRSGPPSPPKGKTRTFSSCPRPRSPVPWP